MHLQHSASKIVQPEVSATILHRGSLVNTLQNVIGGSTVQEKAAQYKLVLLSAPAGYGKTTLLADFAQHTTIPCCWYFLDQADEDPLTFMELLIASIQQHFPQFGPTLNAQYKTITDNDTNHTVQIRQLENLMNAIVTAISHDIKELFALFLCNYHEVNSNHLINTLVDRLLRQLPKHAIIVIESRSVPSLDLAPLVAQRQLFGLGNNILQFTAKDIQDLTALQGIPPFTEDEATQLVTSFDGWIAGILLGTRLGNIPSFTSLSTDSLTSHSVLYNDRRHLFAYLVNEVFKREPEIYSLLKEISLLDQITPQLCDELLHITDATVRLATVEQKGMFISRSYDGRSQIYTCHPILREILYTEFYQQDKERAISLHKKAAYLLHAAKEYHRAIHHAITAGDYELACTFIEEIAEAFLRQGHTETILRWLNMLPSETVEQSPRLLLSRAIIHTSRRETEQARSLLEKAQKYIEHNPMRDQHDTNSPILAEILIVKSETLFDLGKYEQAQKLCQHIISLLSADEREIRAKAYQRIGICKSLLGDFTTGITHMQHALQLWGHNREILYTALLHGNLANAYDMIGNYALSEHHRTRAITSCDHLGDKRGKINNLIGLAITKRNKGALSEADTMLNEVLIMARDDDFSSGEAYALVNLGEIYQDQGEFNEALTATEDCLSIARQIGDNYLTNAALCSLAFTYLFLGDPFTATLHLEQMDIKEGDTTSFAGATRELTQGTIYLQQKRYQEALHHLTIAETSLNTVGLKRLYLRSLIRLAICKLAMSQQIEATKILHKIHELTEQGNYEHIVEIELCHFPEYKTTMEHVSQTPTHPSEYQEPTETHKIIPQTDLAHIERAQISPKLRILALGEPIVEIDGAPITRWRMAHSMELYFFLLDQKKAVHKEQIIEQLWREPDDHIDQTLRSTIFYLRKALGESCIIHRSGSYYLNLDTQYEKNIWYDVEIFEQNYIQAKQAIESENDIIAKPLLLNMVNIYRGDYVQSFYSDWCSLQRDKLRSIYSDTRHQLALIAWRSDELDESITHWQHILAIDSCQEEAHYGLMRCYIRQGKRSLALRQYQRCVTTLQKELSVAPGPSLQKLYQRLTA